MRTTNKQFKEQVQKHIMERLSEDETTELKGQLQNVADEFSSWYSPYEQKRTPSRYMAFKEFMLGMPSVLNAETYYDEIHNNLKSWFENCGESYKNQPEDKEATIYYHLVTRELETLCKKNNVNLFDYNY